MRGLLWLVVALLSGFVFWARHAELDQVVRVPATAVVSSRSQVIQSEQGGVVSHLEVTEGDRVQAGQLLLRLDSTQAQAGYFEALSQVAALEAQQGRLRAEVFGGDPEFSQRAQGYPDFVDAQAGLLAKRRGALADDIVALERLKQLFERELDVAARLRESGDLGLVEVLRLEREIAQLDAQITQKRNEFFREAQTQLNQVQQDLARVTQTLAQRQAVLEATELRAPVAGEVKDVRVTTLGEVIRPGEDILQLVPADDLLVFDLQVQPRDIAFVKVGQSVQIKVDAYDFTQYGALSGTVTYISGDTLDAVDNQGPAYRARVEVAEAGDSDIVVLPGMTAQVDIQTDRQTVWSILTKPVTRTLAEGLRER